MQDNKITADGRERWKQTDDYQQKVAEIKKEVIDQYALLLLNEQNWLKRLIIRGKRSIEIRKRVAKLNSNKNLHLAGDPATGDPATGDPVANNPIAGRLMYNKIIT